MKVILRLTNIAALVSSMFLAMLEQPAMFEQCQFTAPFNYGYQRAVIIFAKLIAS